MHFLEDPIAADGKMGLTGQMGGLSKVHTRANEDLVVISETEQRGLA